MKQCRLFKALFIILLVLLILLTGCTTAKSSQKEPAGKKPAGTGSLQNAGPGMYTVVRVIDGDTIVISYNGNSEKLRFIGVNTPEINHPEKGAEPFGVEAAEYTQKLLENQTIRLKFDVQQRDEYGRLLGYVFLVDGTFFNARLLQEGYAQVMTVPPNDKYAEDFVWLEREARKAEKGLWGIFYYTMDGSLETE